MALIFLAYTYLETRKGDQSARTCRAEQDVQEEDTRKGDQLARTSSAELVEGEIHLPVEPAALDYAQPVVETLPNLFRTIGKASRSKSSTAWSSL